MIERSDILVQIVDARNPLLFRSADLEQYLGEFQPPKQCVLLVNKADLLSKEQLLIWQNYFESQNIKAIFWSATASNEPPPDSSDDDEEQEDVEVSEQLKRTSLSEEEIAPFVRDPEVC